MASVESALRKAVADLNAIRARWALVGGLAVSARTIPRFTKDLDFAVAVADDGEAGRPSSDTVARLSPALIPSWLELGRQRRRSEAWEFKSLSDSNPLRML